MLVLDANILIRAVLGMLESLGEVIQLVEFETYLVSEEEARRRPLGRDPDDWPVLATARPQLPDLDGRHRFLRCRCSHLDDGSRGDVPPRCRARLGSFALSAARISRLTLVKRSRAIR